MITSLEIENFKAIGSPGVRIDIKPITLLFGPNSSGKSTIIQALHLLRADEVVPFHWAPFKPRQIGPGRSSLFLEPRRRRSGFAKEWARASVRSMGRSTVSPHTRDVNGALHAQSPLSAQRHLGEYFRFFNDVRPHLALGGATSRQVWNGEWPLTTGAGG